VTSAPRTDGRLGDRLEEALEHHADLEGEIARGEASVPTRTRIIRTVVPLSITAVSLYLVAPALLDTLAASKDLDEIALGWLPVMLALQAASTVSLWWLQAIAMHTDEWHAVGTSQLAGNAMAKVAPGGGAIGAAVQYRMLVQSGMQRARAVSGLTAANLLTLAVVLALPVLAIPTLVRGAVNRNLLEAALVGIGVFVVLFAIGTLLLAFDRPLERVGELLQAGRNRVRRRSRPVAGLPQRLLRERQRILETVGARWRAALAAGIGRWMFDYASLLAALAAVGSTPRPGLVLLAFCTAQLLAQIPATPGGLGFVEAGLTASLTLAGVSPADAVLATFAYRLLTYWLPLPLGLAAVIMHRRRYGGADPA
jgi:uncharacterized protein (TIRG00374 family)